MMPGPEHAESGKPGKPGEPNVGATDDGRHELTITAPPTWHGTDGAGSAPGAAARTWRHELPRWLATLNSGRTPREYEKAVSYFFLTPGVPDALDEITFDLLLAYRGALALRATPRERGAAYMPNSLRRDRRAPALDTPRPANALPTGGSEGETGEEAGDAPADTLAPLAPATVNIRLTALRQFLVHCTLMGLLPDLSSERIRAALRRLPIERRRPYQILAEAEWEEFLRAALLPTEHAAERDEQPPSDAASTGETERMKQGSGPWGMPRAVRLERSGAQHSDADTAATDTALAEAGHAKAVGVKSRFGLTGARTAQRDHALVALALATGLRAIEISQLDIADLQREWHAGREEWWLVLPDAKTKGQKGGRTLPLAPQLVETLLAYVRATGRKWENPVDQATPLFLSVYERRQRGSGGDRSVPRAARRLLPGQIARIVDRVEAQRLALREERAARGDNISAGETRAISTHALRHSTAVALLEGNAATGRPPASVEHVRGWLGHFDIRTTQGYLAHLDARRHRRPFTLSPVAGATPAEEPLPAPGTSGNADGSPGGA